MMSLLFNMLSRFVIAFLPRSKCLLISWQQSPSAVILKTKKIKSVTVSIIFIKRENLDRVFEHTGETTHMDKGRDQGDAPTSQGMP